MKLDENTIIGMNKELKLKCIDDFFKVHEASGESILYQLVVKKCITPLFWIKYNRHFKQSEYENEKHKRFRKICDYLNQQFV
jgi:hypothetical protein